MEVIISLDQKLFLLLNGWNSIYADRMMSVITNPWAWVPVFLITLLYLIKHYNKKQILWIIGGLAFASILSEHFVSTFLKPFIGRVRPCHDDSLSVLVHTVVGCGGRYAWPSAHAANTFMMAGFIILMLNLKPKDWLFWGLCVYAMTVSYSRVYVGVHYPMDILSGAVIGLCVAYAVHKLLVFVRPELSYL